MKFTLFLKEEAVQDLTEAFDWYEYKQSGLGAEFLTEVDAFHSSQSLRRDSALHEHQSYE